MEKQPQKDIPVNLFYTSLEINTVNDLEEKESVTIILCIRILFVFVFAQTG